MFSTLPLSEQLDRLFGARNCETLLGDHPGDLHIVATRLLDRALMVVGFDYSRRHGSMGTREADQIVETLRTAKQSGTPVAFLMNTSGVRVTEGTAAVASLRSILREALDACLSGARMAAVIAKNCFGGASMLASLCERRIVNQHCLIGMSGPKLIEQVSGTGDLRASDTVAVRRLLGGEARAKVSDTFLLSADDPEAYRGVLVDWLQQPTPPQPNETNVSENAERLSRRLRASTPLPQSREECEPIDTKTSAVLARIFPDGYQADRVQGIVIAHPHGASQDLACGLIGGGAAGADQALRLSKELSRLASDKRRIFLLLDSESHSASAIDERLILSEYLAHLALQTRLLHRLGHEIQVIVTGVSGGGIFAALASGASKVYMTPQAKLRVLPQAAMAAINKAEDPKEGAPDVAVSAQAIDDIYTLTA